MSVSIVTCPSCDAMLLDDTVQCPSCQHVLRPDVFAAQGLETLSSNTNDSIGERTCPACGEGVRHGLVRCFNCGTFMNQEVQQSFLRQVAGGGPAEKQGGYTTSETTSTDYSGGEGTGASTSEPGRIFDDLEDVSLADDEDFEVSPEFTMRAPSEHLKSYKVTWSDGSSAAEESEEEQGGTYNLAGAAPAPAAEEAAPAAAAPPLPAEAATTPAPAAAKEARPSANGAAASNADDGEDHSVATAGDVLLQIALDEEKQQSSRKSRGGGKRRSGKAVARSPEATLVFCPNGHKIEVKSKHQGMMGRCPKCKMPFFVPLAPATPEPSAETKSTELDMSTATAAPLPPGAIAPTATTVGNMKWLADVSLHTVNPTKIKAKPGCLAKVFAPADLVFRPEGLAVLTLVKGGGFMGLGAKKPDAARQAVQTHLTEGKPLSEAPAAAKSDYAKETLIALKVVQPAVYAHESPFGDVPVFGDGRIAVQLPVHADAAEKQFVSFPLSRFREFVELIRSQYGLSEFGENCGVPLTESHTEAVCTFSETKLKPLADIAFYKADPAYKLEVIGRQCEGCGIFVSEDARKKEKIGGLDGKGIAKAKCPKCTKKFGGITLYALGSNAPATPTAPAAAEAATK